MNAKLEVIGAKRRNRMPPSGLALCAALALAQTALVSLPIA